MTTDERRPDDNEDGDDLEQPDPRAGAHPTRREPVDPEESIDTEQHPDIA